MTSAPTLIGKVAELRNAFDLERAIPVSTATGDQMEDLLAIRVSRDAYALRVNEISGLTVDRKIVALPSPIPELLGIAGIRGVLVPVYDLATLFAYAMEKSEARWLALCGGEEPIALAFDDFEGYLRVPQAELYPADEGNSPGTHVAQVVRVNDVVRPVASIPRLRARIRERYQSRVLKER